MIKSLFIVGLGSFFGGALRYYVSTLIKTIGAQGFPWGTLAVNLLGSFVFGVMFALFSKCDSHSGSLCLLLTTGLCGGFTTFSTFAHESVQMLQSGNLTGFFFYVAASVVFGFLSVGLGYLVIK